MAVAFGSIGARVAGAANHALAYPSGVAAGHLAIACRVGWQTLTFSDEAGWTPGAELAGGIGSVADNHPSRARIDHKLLTGSESGTVTFDHAGGAQGAIGCMLRYSKGSGEFLLQYATGTDETHGANRNVDASSTLSLEEGDVLVAVVAIDSDAALTYTSAELTAPSITFDATNRRTTSAAGSSLGGDGNIEVFDATVTSGSATATPTFTMLGSSPSNCGPVIFLRLREGAVAGPLTAQRVGAPVF
jgi:hypothetical protein